jgi:hypothetical protein
MKKSTVAAALNFVIPGAGLWYLGRKFWAFANLLGAMALVPGITAAGQFGEQIHYVMLAVAAGSAGLAHAVASTAEQ